jgi:callose synthase
MWASYRGQTLARTVRGMMYYERSVSIQELLVKGFDVCMQ